MQVEKVVGAPNQGLHCSFCRRPGTPIDLITHAINIMLCFKLVICVYIYIYIQRVIYLQLIIYVVLQSYLSVLVLVVLFVLISLPRLQLRLSQCPHNARAEQLVLISAINIITNAISIVHMLLMLLSTSLICYAFSYRVIYYAILCYAILCYTMLYYTILYYYHTILHYTRILPGQGLGRVRKLLKGCGVSGHGV